MSHRESSRRPSLRSETTYAPKNRQSRRRTLSDILEPPKDDPHRVIVRSPSSRRINPTVSEHEDSRTRRRPPSRPPAEMDRERHVSSDEESDHWDSYSSVDDNFDLICNPRHAKDVGVRLEFDVLQDLDDELEEFNQFVRRGEFRAAKTFFNDNLLAHITSPWVFVQYAEMLFEMGDYKSLLLLDPEPVFRTIASANEYEHYEAIRRLEINWRLLKASCLSRSQHELGPVLDEICLSNEIVPVRQDVGSTEIRIICLTIALMDIANRRIVGLTEFPHNLADWGDWKHVYELLQAQGRIWDFRDFFTTFCFYFGIESAEEQLLGSRSILQAIAEDWVLLMDDDEATLLAIVDLLTSIVLYVFNHAEDQLLRKKYLVYASTLAEAVMTEHPRCTKTRPFLQFIVAQSSMSLRTGSGSQSAYSYLDDFPGLAGFSYDLELPYYLPVRQENPGWNPPDLPESSIEPLEMALEASRGLDDYRTQALCLKALAVRSREPSRLFEELIRVQKVIQQDMEGYLTTCLSRYLVSNDRDSKYALLGELNRFGWWHETSKLLRPDKGCARDIIQQALSVPHQNHVSKSVEAGFRHYNWLPGSFQHFIAKHMLPQQIPPPQPQSRPLTVIPLRPRSQSSTAIRLPPSPGPVPPRMPDLPRQLAPGYHSDDSQDDSEVETRTYRIGRSRSREMRAIPEEAERPTADHIVVVERRSPSLRTKSRAPPTTSITSRPTIEDEARDEKNHTD
ncbi:uncharacterized protein NECHADRAFT_86755 [Fusarium vanettenii 77-13-4]|uniref:Uncharacterized protein n=1 Tax=Fusarium vanettenii (strain ATCC MYA-4622 / CBS 123669 / FGSC 9596 / NRRL 45880 / 77-13-4) TaxID=660122 RepID=C7ZFX2_FUSV7|nr:uncharacterized protein NECHADRAFT_86755 [Fusarium vanettenii 77-13-4]EEU37133.1 hypothetical protein NECHADRAFT_86755 [Fusarium vanettenii 77-13-4]